MKSSQTIAELAKALNKAQAVMESAKKETKNTFFGSVYADLNSVIQAAKKPMTDNGLAITQLPEVDNGIYTLNTVLLHTSGEWIESRTIIPLTKNVKSDSGAINKLDLTSQELGSAMTYARRYGYQAILGMTAEDDDGNSASAPMKPVNEPKINAWQKSKLLSLDPKVLEPELIEVDSVDDLTLAQAGALITKFGLNKKS